MQKAELILDVDRSPESRMMGNYPVRFGGGRLEKGRDRCLASRLPYVRRDS